MAYSVLHKTFNFLSGHAYLKKFNFPSSLSNLPPAGPNHGIFKQPGHDLDLCCWRTTNPHVSILTHPSPVLSAVSRAANCSQLFIPWVPLSSHRVMSAHGRRHCHSTCTAAAPQVPHFVYPGFSDSPQSKAAGDDEAII